MPSRVMLRFALALALAGLAGSAVACSAAPESGSADSVQPVISAPQEDAGLTGICASSFGDELTPGFGRIDGVVYAVQKPSDQECAMPNRDHVIVQVLMNGAVYRLVTNVMSDRPGSDPRVQMLVKDGVPLPAPAFAEGWHTGSEIWIDYVRHFNVHAEQFTPLEMDPLVEDIASRIHVGDPISVYAQSGQGRPESAHLVHRNGRGKDGAIVLYPTTHPTYLLFHFAEQRF